MAKLPTIYITVNYVHANGETFAKGFVYKQRKEEIKFTKDNVLFWYEFFFHLPGKGTWPIFL